MLQKNFWKILGFEKRGFINYLTSKQLLRKNT